MVSPDPVPDPPKLEWVLFNSFHLSNLSSNPIASAFESSLKVVLFFFFSISGVLTRDQVVVLLFPD